MAACPGPRRSRRHRGSPRSSRDRPSGTRRSRAAKRRVPVAPAVAAAAFRRDAPRDGRPRADRLRGAGRPRSHAPCRCSGQWCSMARQLRLRDRHAPPPGAERDRQGATAHTRERRRAPTTQRDRQAAEATPTHAARSTQPLGGRATGREHHHHPRPRAMTQSGRPWRLKEMTPGAVRERLRSGRRWSCRWAPPSSTGHICPLGCDTIIVEHLADDLSAAFGILRAPTVEYGVHAPARASRRGLAPAPHAASGHERTYRILGGGGRRPRVRHPDRPGQRGPPGGAQHHPDRRGHACR